MEWIVRRAAAGALHQRRRDGETVERDQQAFPDVRLRPEPRRGVLHQRHPQTRERDTGPRPGPHTVQDAAVPPAADAEGIAGEGRRRDSRLVGRCRRVPSRSRSQRQEHGECPGQSRSSPGLFLTTGQLQAVAR